MASKEELMKQQRTLHARPRTNAPSYTMDRTGELKQVSTVVEEPVKPVEQPVQPKEQAQEPKAEKLVEIEKPVVEKKEEAKAASKSAASKEEVVKSVTVRLVDVDDADFLKYACKAKGMNMQEFFWSIIEADMKSSKKINPRDEEHVQFKSIPLPEIRTIPIPKQLKEKIGVTSGMHRLPETRYMAMVIHKARLQDPGWS